MELGFRVIELAITWIALRAVVVDITPFTLALPMDVLLFKVLDANPNATQIFRNAPLRPFIRQLSLRFLLLLAETL